MKRDINITHNDDHVSVQLLSEDAVAWAEENFSPKCELGSVIKLPGDGKKFLEAMREDGLTE